MNKELFDFIFLTILMLVNAAAFIPQTARIWRLKTSAGVSPYTYIIFLVIQFYLVFHSYFYNADYPLAIGYFISMLTCSSVLISIYLYRDTSAQPKLPVEIYQAISQLPGHLYIKDRQGKGLWCNTNNAKDFGLSSSNEFIGKYDRDLFETSEAEKIAQVDKSVVQSGNSIIAEETISIDGNERLYLSLKYPLLDPKGNVLGIIGNSIDITDAKKETHETLAMLENIIAVMPGYVYWMNSEGVYLGCNDREAKVIGLTSRKEIVGKRNIDMPGFLIAEELDPVNEHIMSTGKAITLEEPAKLPDGTEGIFISSKTPLKDDKNNIIGLLGISIDITDRKQMENELITAKEKAEVANKAKKEFLYNMRHDIRTPFSGITGMATLLKTQETDEKKLQYINNIYTSSEELLDYLNTILELTQIERGAIPVVSSLVDVKLLIQSCFNMFSSSIAAKQIDFTFNCDEATSFKCNTDEFRIKRIVINLLGNAIKFTGSSGSITIDLCLLNTKASTPQIQISVRDTGIGIPIEKQNIIFEKFERLTSSYRGDYKGTGLGLYAVKTLINELSGDVKVISESGKGATFTCDIPVKKATTRDDEGMLLDAKNTDRPTFKNTISSPSLLLVEDVEVIQLATATLLENLNCFVDVAGTGRQAIELCRTNNYDLILMDIGLPDIDGYVTTQEIRQLKNYENINIVALTAHAEAEVSQECRLAGMNSVITKPLTQAKAIDLLNTYIVDNPSLE